MPNNSKKRRRLDKEESHVVIVGCGLAGLSAAISLEQAGFRKIVIVERDDNLEQQSEGYGLTLTYNPKGPLASLGLLEQVANADCPSRSHYLFRSDGSIMGYFGNAFSKNRGLGQRGNLRVPRKALRHMLFQKLSITKVHWGHSLLDYRWDEATSQYTVQLQKTKTKDDDDAAATVVGGETEIVSVRADLLVAADGVRSAVLRRLAEEGSQSRPLPNPHFGLRPIGIRLILGIAEFAHPLLQERGFYTLDGKHRLFTMPYESNHYDDSKSNRIMWQLSLLTGGGDDAESYSLEDDNNNNKENNSYEHKQLDPSELQRYVLGVVGKWHNPIEAMVRATPINTVWGTDLVDRDPHQVHQLVKEQHARRLVAVGDALHSMSPFKGQGANQALRDGPLLAHWLQKASIDSAVTSFWRETVQRTAPVVSASRMAAQELHSPSIMMESHGFAGVKSTKKDELLEVLAREKIGAEQASVLDNKVGNIIQLLDAADDEQEPEVCQKQQQRALQFAINGNIQGLRQMTLEKHSESIRTAKDEASRSCLHLAAKSDHAVVCRWLLTEVECDYQCHDEVGKMAEEYCKEDTETFAIFRSHSKLLGSSTSS